VWIWWIEEGGGVDCGSPEGRNEEDKRNAKKKIIIIIIIILF
jgi:hypothetical protein